MSEETKEEAPLQMPLIADRLRDIIKAEDEITKAHDKIRTYEKAIVQEMLRRPDDVDDMFPLLLTVNDERYFIELDGEWAESHCPFKIKRVAMRG